MTQGGSCCQGKSASEKLTVTLPRDEIATGWTVEEFLADIVPLNRLRAGEDGDGKILKRRRHRQHSAPIAALLKPGCFACKNIAQLPVWLFGELNHCVRPYLPTNRHINFVLQP